MQSLQSYLPTGAWSHWLAGPGVLRGISPRACDPVPGTVHLGKVWAEESHGDTVHLSQ